MLAVFVLVLPMEPAGKGRARSSRSGHHYTPGKTRALEKLVQDAADKAWGDKPPMTGALRLVFVGYCKKTKASRTKYGKEWPTKKPDLSNIVKLVEDALNSVVYDDDAQIVQEFIFKEWADEPSIVVQITQLGEEDHGAQENFLIRKPPCDGL